MLGWAMCISGALLLLSLVISIVEGGRKVDALVDESEDR